MQKAYKLHEMLFSSFVHHHFEYFDLYKQIRHPNMCLGNFEAEGKNLTSRKLDTFLTKPRKRYEKM